jgi:hypothetical protein
MFVHFLAIFAGAVQVLGFIFYFQKVRASQTQPNTSAWFLWVLIGTVNAASYHTMPDVDWVKACVAIVNALCCISFAVYALWNGKFKRLLPFEWLATIVGVTAISGWYITSNAQVGNGILQGAYVLSFIPLYVALWREPKREQALCWLLWAGSHVIGICVVAIAWQGHPLDLLYSGIQVPMDLSVIFLTLRKTKIAT